MAEIPLGWRLSVQGAEEVKSKLAGVNAEFARGDISVKEYSKALREVNRDARAFVTIGNVQKNLFLATHPTLNNLTRAMSVFGSVMRSVATTMLLINTAQIALNTNNSSTIRAQANLQQALREQADALSKFGENSKEYIEATEKVNIANAEVSEAAEQAANNLRNFWLSLVTGLSGVATAIILAIPKISPFFNRLLSLAIPLEVISGLLKGLSKIALPLVILDFFSMMGEQLAGDGQIAQGLDALIEIFTVDIPKALAQLPAFFINVWNIIVSATEGFVNNIISGIESMINSFISAVNTMIRAYNSVASKLGLGKLSTLGSVVLPRANLQGVESNQVDLARTGLSVETHPFLSGGGRGGGGTTIAVNVEGSVITAKELDEIIDNALKVKLLEHGFQ